MSEPKEKPPAHRSKRGWQRILAGRLGVLAERDFGIFCAGYAMSLLGSATSEIALTFAVLGSGSAADLGYVFAGSVVPQVGAAAVAGAGSATFGA